MQKKILLPWTAAVLAAHVWLLWWLPTLSLERRSPQLSSAIEFATRSIAQPPPAALPAAAPAPVKPKPAPAKPKPARAAPQVPIEQKVRAPDDAGEEQIQAAQVQPAETADSEASAETPAQDAALPEAGIALRTPDAEPQAAALQLPAPAQLSYDVVGQVKNFHYSASGEIIWQHDGRNYFARQQIKAFLLGARTQTSRGTIDSSGLVPERFSDRSRSEKTTEFDFASQQARFSANNLTVAIGPGSQDRLSVFFQLSGLLAALSLPEGSEISFTTLGTSHAERWTFRVQGFETLELPIGTLLTLKLERLPRNAQDQQATLWLAPTLGYLPARIRLSQANGDFADLQLRTQTAAEK